MLHFAKLIVEGKSQTDAYAAAYGSANRKTIKEKACRLAAHPRVKAEIARLRAKSETKVLLTLNDRLRILAEIAQEKTNRPNEKARAIEVYSKISGDQAPERHDHTLAGPGGGPIPTVEIPLAERFTTEQKIEKLKARRLGILAAPVLATVGATNGTNGNGSHE